MRISKLLVVGSFFTFIFLYAISIGSHSVKNDLCRINNFDNYCVIETTQKRMCRNYIYNKDLCKNYNDEEIVKCYVMMHNLFNYCRPYLLELEINRDLSEIFFLG